MGNTGVEEKGEREGGAKVTDIDDLIERLRDAANGSDPDPQAMREAADALAKQDAEIKRLCDQWPSGDERAAQAQAEIAELRKDYDDLVPTVQGNDEYVDKLKAEIAELLSENAKLQEALKKISRLDGRDSYYNYPASLARAAINASQPATPQPHPAPRDNKSL